MIATIWVCQNDPANFISFNRIEFDVLIVETVAVSAFTISENTW